MRRLCAWRGPCFPDSDFFRSRKKKKAAAAEAAEVMELDVDPAGIEPPVTRFTEEYREFLASQETAEETGIPAREECPEPEDAPEEE